MNYLLTLAISFLLYTNACSQKLYTEYIQYNYNEKFGLKFETAIKYLGRGQTTEALNVLIELYQTDSLHAYINYLMGVCYTEQEKPSEKSIFHLERATNDIRIDYDKFSYKERRAPVFTYYYLTKAYAQNGMCKEADESKEIFKNLYGPQKEDFFYYNVENFSAVCIPSKKIKYKRTTNIVTRKNNYTTDSPLYGVQVAAYKELVPVRAFQDLDNVEAYIDKDGTIRYVIGHFAIKKHAETLKKILNESGYPDAFIVDVNKEKKYNEEIISVDNMSFKHKIKGKIDFRVQVGAFKDSIPVNILQMYMQVKGIKEIHQNGLTLIQAGSFKYYSEAEEYKNEINKIGINDAFIVAYNYDKKIPVKEALKYLEKGPVN